MQVADDTPPCLAAAGAAVPAAALAAHAAPQQMLRAAGLRPKKAWGQNFLRDRGALLALAAAAVPAPGATVVELGAGLGALTEALLLAGAQVFAVERDRELVPLLRRRLAAYPGLTVCEADAVRFDHVAQARRGPYAVAGNLPYQLSGRILVGLAAPEVRLTRAVLLLQREVAQRLVAAPGGRDYGLLTVLVGRALRARLLLSVPPSAFHPPPKVHSAAVLLEPRPAGGGGGGGGAGDAGDAALVAAARAAFSARRKTLRNALAGHFGRPPAAACACLAAADIDPTERAERLDLAAFARLGEALSAAGWLGPAAAA